MRKRRRARLESDPFAPVEDTANADAVAAKEAKRAAGEARAVAGPGGSAESAPRSKSLLARAREGLGGKAARRSAATGGKAAGGSSLGEARAASNYARSRAALQAAEAGPAAAKAGFGGRLAAAVSTAAPVLGGVLAGVAAFVAASLILSTLLGAIAGFWQDEQDKAMIEGLPGFITYDMVLEALECQEEYGHPAGCTIAQVICESGQGDAMSQLATRDHNLFGIKWASSFASCPEVAGKASWATHEEVGGQVVTVMADFTVFKSDADCIRFRSRVFLQNSRYADNAFIKEAIADHDSDKMAEGLKDAGYATSSEYVESLKSVMRTYNLYRFDGMGVDDFEKGAAGGDAIVQAAYSQLGVPYAWGGSTPGVGLDCSGLTQYCYRQAGISISHYTEDQLKELTVVPLSQARPGDILYKYGHVAIYVGGDEYIHEPRTGDVCRKATGISYFTCALRYTG
ncbi:hydrolase Nlp/P60 [Eggerthella lenta]|uniref:Hydrolase Nlp/P60 n=1 Tax=Eggerthella lenta TaxID=84112 RepID=A0A369MR04_EGGLN|nr:hydrolase Nlp/P60 [Eggerthella lenta]RDC44625.1 hydrolase Nlp/P60 [Eggerthella lenta]